MVVLDTHAWLWWVSQPSYLSRTARNRIRTATRIGISAISCLEVAIAVAKGRISLDRELLDWLEHALALPRVELVPLTPIVALKAIQLGTDFPGDPGDRVIVATSIVESAPLVTKDSKIRNCPAASAVW